LNTREHYGPGRYVGFALLAVLVVGILAFVLSGIFLPRSYPANYYPYFPFFPFGWVFGFFWIFVLFWALRWVFWPYRRRGYWGHGWYRDSSYYIIRERYAKGEITKEQYDRMMQDLESN
jgi:putative membrane protein